MNGKTALLGQKADPEVDEITVDGRPLALVLTRGELERRFGRVQG